MGSYCLMGTEFQFGKMKEDVVMLYSSMNVLNTMKWTLKNGQDRKLQGKEKKKIHKIMGEEVGTRLLP